MIRSAIPASLLLAAGAVAAPPPAQADDFYKGKTVSIVVGFSSGGGFDRNARTVARHIGKYIPGNPNVIVQNLPGAGSLKAVRALDVTAPKDGTVLTVFNPGLVTQSMVLPERVKVDFRKFAWVGIITADFRVCYGFGPKGVRSWADLFKRKEFILGATSKGSGSYINGAQLRVVFKAPIRQILGFPGSAEQRLAIERGELDGDCGSFSSIPIKWVTSGKVHPFVRFSEERAPEIPKSAAYVNSFAKSARQLQLLNVLNAGDEIGRPIIMSSQVPKDRVAIIRKAFDATVKDKAFRADMAKQKLPLFPRTGLQAAAIVDKMRKAPPEVLAEAKAIYK